MSDALPLKVDVLVVGCGPVGAAVTCLLGQYGMKTLTVDKNLEIFKAPRAIALDNEALRILQMVGLSESSFDKINIPLIRFRSPLFGEFSRINTVGKIDGHAKLVTFYQPDLEQALRDLASQKESVNLCLGIELLDFEESQGCVQAILKLSDGSQHRISTEFLVAADGASSKIRNKIGQRFEGKTYNEDWLIVDASEVGSDFDHVEFVCNPFRPIAHMVAPGGRTRWEFMLMPGETREQMESPEKIQELLLPWNVSPSMKMERKAVYRFHARSCDKYSKGRIFLVGDAAHITPPFVGQGLVSGLRDAANLSWKLAWALNGRIGFGALESYDRERRPHAKKMIDFAVFAGQFIMPRNRLAAFLIHGFAKVLHLIPFLRRYFGEPKTKLNLQDGLFIKSRRRIFGSGFLFPCVDVESGSGRKISTDDLIDKNFALIIVNGKIDDFVKEEYKKSWEKFGGICLSIRDPNLYKNVIRSKDYVRISKTPWCIIVRPDRIVMHESPANEVNSLIEVSLDLLSKYK